MYSTTNAVPNAGHIYSAGGHSHSWNNTGNWAAPSAMSFSAMPDYGDVVSLFINNKNLTEAVEDLAFTLKFIIEKYELDEISAIKNLKSINEWAESGRKRILKKTEIKEIEETEEHMDEKLFEI